MDHAWRTASTPESADSALYGRLAPGCGHLPSATVYLDGVIETTGLGQRATCVATDPVEFSRRRTPLDLRRSAGDCGRVRRAGGARHPGGRVERRWSRPEQPVP